MPVVAIADFRRPPPTTPSSLTPPLASFRSTHTVVQHHGFPGELQRSGDGRARLHRCAPRRILPTENAPRSRGRCRCRSLARTERRRLTRAECRQGSLLWDYILLGKSSLAGFGTAPDYVSESSTPRGGMWTRVTSGPGDTLYSPRFICTEFRSTRNSGPWSGRGGRQAHPEPQLTFEIVCRCVNDSR